MVRHAAQALTLTLLAAAAVGGCGGGENKSEPQSATVAPAAATPASSGNPDLGVDVRLASCTDWARGDVVARKGTIAEIRGFAGGPVDSGHGAVLSVDAAYRLFDGWCSRSYASNFKLYKLYTRAAAFTPQQ